MCWENLRRIKNAKKMSSIIIEKINIGVVGEITLGSDMTKDLLLPCFSFSLQIIQ